MYRFNCLEGGIVDIIERLRKGKGFIAALDQSGGSSKKTLVNYGFLEKDIINDDVMFDFIHQMRSRLISNKYFDSKHILGVILFNKTMKGQINGINTVKYLREKDIVSFLKIDLGLDEESDGVQLLKNIDNLDDILKEAKDYGIVGTKMRSVIKEYNEYGIKKVVEQQFKLAKKIISYGLIPIIEPEVDINSKDKKNIETYLKKELLMHLDKMNKEDYIIFKFTLPDIPNYYDPLLKYKNVLRIVALSGGYDRNKACELLKLNKNMIASFSRALLEGLSINQNDEEYSNILNNTIKQIYDASVKK